MTQARQLEKGKVMFSVEGFGTRVSEGSGNRKYSFLC